MPRCFVSVGSNIAPEQNVEAAVQALADAFRVTGVSPFYRSAAIGPDGAPADQPDFINGVVRIETDVAAEGLRNRLHRIEAHLGRRRSADRHAPRTIDLDVILWGARVQEHGLVLPDPGIPRHPHLYVPLRDLEPDLILPGSAIRLADLPPAPDLRPVPGLSRLRAPP